MPQKQDIESVHKDFKESQLMGAAADLKPMTPWPFILTEGGDDRLPLDESTGCNKYHAKPLVASHALFRGSCTCNSPTQLAFDAAKEVYEQFRTGYNSVEQSLETTRERIKAVYGLSEGTGVFLTPSGSDAEYIPLIIAKAIHGQDKKIVNIVTCNDEVGSGTLGASGGRFFSPLEPIPGYTGHMDVVEMDSPVLGLAENVETVTVQARKASGEVVDAKPEIMKALEEAAIKDAMPIVHSVFGSKTGICQELHDFAAEQVTVAGGLYVVDACQGRFPDRMVNDLLEQGVIVLITGSKFYRGPPFSGGCLVPSCIMEALKEIQRAGELPPIAKGLNTFIGKSEIPRELHAWRDTIENNMNPGLALRWEAGLAEMEATLSIDENKRLAAIDHWRKQVIAHINKFDNLDYFSAAEDTKSIVSLRVIHPDTGKWMVKSELAKVFKALTLDLSEQFPEVDDVVSRICFTGQPVHISKDEAVLRIALGSDSLREVIKNLDHKQNTASQTDMSILEKMSFISYKFNEL